jgi:hypothetical protein
MGFVVENLTRLFRSTTRGSRIGLIPWLRGETPRTQFVVENLTHLL